VDEPLAKSFYDKRGNYEKISLTDAAINMDEKCQPESSNHSSPPGDGSLKGLGPRVGYGISKSHEEIICLKQKMCSSTFNLPGEPGPSLLHWGLQAN
jgi:hypothetical protein